MVSILRKAAIWYYWTECRLNFQVDLSTSLFLVAGTIMIYTEWSSYENTFLKKISWASLFVCTLHALIFAENVKRLMLTDMSLRVFCLCPPLREISGSDNTFFSPLYQKPTFPMHPPNLIYSPVYSLTNVLDYIICVENIVGMKNTRGSVTSGCNDESGLTSCQCSQLKQRTGEWQMLNSELLTLTL